MVRPGAGCLREGSPTSTEAFVECELFADHRDGWRWEPDAVARQLAPAPDARRRKADIAEALSKRGVADGARRPF